MAPASATLASRACAADMAESALPSFTVPCGERLEESKKDECSGYFDWDALDDAGKGASSGPASDIDTPAASLSAATLTASDGELSGESDERVNHVDERLLLLWTLLLPEGRLTGPLELKKVGSAAVHTPVQSPARVLAHYPSVATWWVNVPKREECKDDFCVFESVVEPTAELTRSVRPSTASLPVVRKRVVQ
eukprot:1547591-Amphidinium_carterae.4